MLQDIKKMLQKKASPVKAKLLAGFFKTGKGQYGEGDVFLGVMVPETRKVALHFKHASLKDLHALLSSAFHEERLCALFILVHQFQHADASHQKKLVDFYLKHAGKVNNWDLVDLSAPKLLGAYLLSKPRKKLFSLAQSKNLWKRRIAVLSCFAFIKENDFKDAFAIAEFLLQDPHDLIHKAVGWMLREIGKKDQPAEEHFLKKHAKHMPRTMLRYAIEKFPEPKRRQYLNQKGRL